MKKFILIGNPNTGKTTLYNTITKSHEHVGNWHGVTVGVVEKKFKIDGEECVLVDLPGVYSLDSYSLEEKISVEYLKNNKDAIVINICDANNIERNLLLTLQLAKLGVNTVIAMNMYNENKNVDYKKLQAELKMPVFEVDARKKKSVNSFLSSILNLEKIEHGLNIIGETADQIHRQIRFIMNKVYRDKPKFSGLTIIDKIVLNKWLFIPIFIIVIGIIFYLTFSSLGAFLSGILNNYFQTIANSVLKSIHSSIGETWFYYFLADAIFGGIASVLSFLPQVGLLFFFFGFLEDVGYLPRVAFMLDGMLKKIGMTGRSLFSLLMGFGCTATALVTTRNMDNIKLKQRTALILPFMSCSAKLPILLVFASAFFIKNKVLFLVGLYLFSIIVGILVSAIYAKITNNKDNNSYFILELPKWRVPSLKRLLQVSFGHVKSFMIKVGTVILLSSTIIWILESFSFDFRYVAGNSSENMLSNIANFIYPIFKPLGFSSSLVVVVILSGLIGKEMVVSSIGMLNSVSLTGLSVAESIILSSSPINFTISSAMSFLIFIMFYSPCISAFEVASRELGYKFAITSFIFQLLLAYILAFVTYSILNNNLWVIFILAVIVLALFVRFMLKLKKQDKKTCNFGGCYGCNQSCR